MADVVDPGGGSSTEFHDISELPLGKLLKVKYDSSKAAQNKRNKKHTKYVRKLLDKGFKGV